jgi:hypothetical protein
MSDQFNTTDNESSDWQSLLVRILDGETLDGEASIQLASALKIPANRATARRWFALQSNLNALGNAGRGFDLVLSREKLLARAALEERVFAQSRVSVPRPKRRPFLVVAATLMSLALMAVGYRLFVWYPESVLGGDFKIERNGNAVADPNTLQRGDSVAFGAHGGTAQIGKCCTLAFQAGAQFVWQGEKSRESIALSSGKVDANVVPEEGGLVVVTESGTVTVLGTQFSTAIERRITEGGTSARIKPVTIVSVSHGRVRVQSATLDRVLTDGQVVTLGDDEGARTAAKVLRADATNAVIATENETFTLEPSSHRAAWDISLLRPNDPVIVGWTLRDGSKVVTSVSGHTYGRITKIDRNAILLSPDHGGSPRRFATHWIGGEPVDGGGLDKPTLALIARQTVGSHVRVTWSLGEGTRLLDIVPVP